MKKIGILLLLLISGFFIHTCIKYPLTTQEVNDIRDKAIERIIYED